MADDLSVAEHGGGVAEAFDLVEPVGNVEDRLALGLQAFEGLEHLVGFLRRQHRGGLVENDQIGLLQQAADDLDALAFTHREIAHHGVRIERQAVIDGELAGGLGDLRDRGLFLQHERDVFGRRQRLEQRKMLENHADAETAGLARAADAHRLTLPQDLALGGIEHAEHHLDERRLAGAVLPEKCVNLARRDRQIDAVTSLDLPEDLGQTDGLQERCTLTCALHESPMNKKQARNTCAQ